MDGWRPIETAPKDGTRIMLYRPTGWKHAKIVFGYWNTNGRVHYFQHDMEFLEGKNVARREKPTHWMPLPQPPA